VRNGGLVTPTYLATGQAPESNDWQASIADMIVNDRQFARNFANRFWGHLMGLAMVEPMDGFDPYRIDPERELPDGWEHQALDLNLLEHMTDKLIEFNYDLRAYLRYVLNSATFQMDSAFAPGNWQERWAPYYTRYLARHMTAEQVYDSIAMATGVTIPMTQVYFGGGETERVNYAHQLADTAQPRGRRQAPIFDFLQSFGRGNRYDQPRSNAGGINQALMMMNSTITNNPQILRSGRIRQYIDQGLDAEAIAGELYLDVFAREPSQQERDALLTELAKFESNTDRTSSALWLLLNKVEFTFIY
jgi:hypothetical protein